MKKYLIVICIVIGFVVIMGSCKKTNSVEESPTSASVSELSAGDETIFDESSSAFGDDFPVISGYYEHIHDIGEVVFNEIFTPPPGYAYSYYTGLGPIYNNNSCNACHGGVGEGNPPIGGGNVLTSMLFRVSMGNDTMYGPTSATNYGGQLQNNAVPGIPGVVPEGTVNVQYTIINGKFADGTPYTLQAPSYTLQNAYAPVPSPFYMSPRVAPRLVGLGYLEAIPASQILANQGADPTGMDTLQINGQPNYVYDATNNQYHVLGRFGWKAEQPSIKQQLCGAYKEDMGVTNSLFPRESSTYQSQYYAYIASGDSIGDPGPELPDSELYANVFYVQTLAVPAFRNGSSAQVQEGQQLFTSVGCASCHTPTFTMPAIINIEDNDEPESNELSTLLGGTVIHPFTDMLLHNMGKELADNRPTYHANGYQYRTPPLWGIGLVPIVDPQGQFLHDGRARTLMEAILWHGGEASAARNNVINLNASQRAALIAFLQSL